MSDFWECNKCTYKFNENNSPVCLMCEVPLEYDIESFGSLIYTTFLKEHSSYVEVHQHNVIIYRQAIDKTQQILLIEDCNTKLNRLSMPGMALNTRGINKPGPVEGFSFQTGWTPHLKEHRKMGQPECLRLATSLHESLISEIGGNDLFMLNSQVDDALKLKPHFLANSIWARIYNEEHGLGFHTDPPGCEWAFIISLGSDVHFEYYSSNEKVEKARKLTLHSGDCIFFNGTSIFHAVINIIPNTQPIWWKENYKRVGLQMREHTNATIKSN